MLSLVYDHNIISLIVRSICFNISFLVAQFENPLSEHVGLMPLMGGKDGQGSLPGSFYHH